MECCKSYINLCQAMPACIQTLIIEGLEPSSEDVLTIEDMMGTQYQVDIESDEEGKAEIEIQVNGEFNPDIILPPAFLNQFSENYLISFKNHQIKVDGIAYQKGQIKVKNIISNETEATIKV